MKKVMPTLIIILGISLGVIFTASSSMSQVQIPEVEINTPQIIVLGSPAVIPLQLTLQLPTGFIWTASSDLPFSINTGDLEDPRALFLLDDATDVNGVIRWAAEVGKEEVYFLYLPPLPPDVKIFYFPELDWTSWKDSFSELISTNEAQADPVPSPSCTGKFSVPAKSCVYGGCVKDSPLCDHNVEDDDTTDNRRPSVTVCLEYESSDCHFTPMDYHIRRNIWLVSRDHSRGGDTSFTDCMKIHNGRDFLKYPVGLRVRVWLEPSEQEFENICRPGNAACATGPPEGIGTPRESVNRRIFLTSRVVNKWSVVRHEMAHTYGYGHCQMNMDKDRLAHCLVGNTRGIIVSPNPDGTCPREFPNQAPNGDCCKGGSPDGSHHVIE